MSRPKFSVGDLVRIYKEGIILEGIVMPKTEFSSEDVVIIKLSNGYNVGVDLRKVKKIEVLERGRVEFFEEGLSPPSSIRGRGQLRLLFMSTGGTIVSKVEYETGAVKPAINASELVEMVPEILEDVSEIKVVELYRIFSEDMSPEIWGSIAERVGKALSEGYNGVIVAHGTDTLSYTAAALAFSLRNLPSPVMLVGAQRSSDRPSTDSVLNLRACPKIAAKAPFGEVVVVMHGHISDTYILVHRGVKVRKMHTSRRDAFQSINDVPLAKVVFPEGRFIQLNRRYLRRAGRVDELVIKSRFSDKVILLKTYPGFDCSLVDYAVDRGYRGVVIEGTGLGHMPNKCIEIVRRAVEEGVVVAMTSQTLFGRINMKVYLTGRRLIEAGVLPSSDMLPEVAYVKLSWLLGNYNDAEQIRKLYLTNLVNEINDVHPQEVYPRWFHGE